MATRQLYVLIGDSKAVGQGAYSSLTDTRYDLVDVAVQATRIIGGVDDGAPVTLAMGANQIGIEHAVGHGRKAAGDALPWIHKHAFSSTLLSTNWRTYITTGTYSQFAASLWSKIASAFPGDVIEYRGLCAILGVNDAESFSAGFETELRRFVQNHRGEFGDVPIFWGKPGTDVVKADTTLSEINAVRDAIDAIAGEFPRFYPIEETGIPLSDGVHPTPDGSQALGDLFLSAMATDGCATNAFDSLGDSARVFASKALADAYLATAQAQHGDRDENPANGGFGARLGSGAIDPWPTSPRSESAEKHPFRDEWFAPVDGPMAAGPLDTTTDARPVNLAWLISA